MKEIYITQEELDMLYPMCATGFNNGGTLYYKSETELYKIFNAKDFITEKERNVDFLIDKDIEHTMLPRKKIILDGAFSGYSLKNFPNSKTFREETKLDYIDRLKIVRDIYSALREIHKLDLFLGDVHRDNFLYNENSIDGVIIDFEEIRFKGDELKFRSYYKIRKSENTPYILKENQNIDNIKTIAACLSFIYGVNLEQFLVVNSVDVLIRILNMLDIPCIKELKECLTNYKGNIKYFDQIMDNFSDQDFYSNYKKIKLIKGRYIF